MNTNTAITKFRQTLAHYRVMALHGDQGLGLVTLAENLRQAVNLAKAFCDQNDGLNQDGIIAVHVEEWLGMLTEGRWERVSVGRGGFSRRLRQSGPLNNDSPNSALPHSGDTVPCVLLPNKTRKGGWKARLGQRELAGPITNSADVPGCAARPAGHAPRWSCRSGRQVDPIPMATGRQQPVAASTTTQRNNIFSSLPCEDVTGPIRDNYCAIRA